ncbi:ubinuclein-2-like [Salvia hispanica]|uniref:ubinuclein-2-like n=1 Tax=Salvia hispanica TaxID=49212 RepID=UPI0020093400|nr:ubinuclein-2-like [Salvia hispanica]
MANEGLSAKQEKYDKIQKMKQEVTEMVKSRAAGKRHKHSFNDVMENKNCKLYDLYVETLEEFSGPLVETLYEELASLWPGGFMNANRIKRAIYRAKERKGIRSFRKDREKIKEKNVLPQDASNIAHGTS